MPQLDITTFSSQLFWLVICFGSLFCVLTFAILPRIGGTIAARGRRLEDDLAAAERLRDEAAQALSAYEEALSEARSKAVSLAQSVRREMQEEMDKQKAEVDQQLAARMAEADARIHTAHEEGMANVHAMVGPLVTDLVEAVARKSIDAAVIDAAVSRQA